MTESKIPKLPQRGKGDTALTLAKAGLSAIPWLGGPAAVLFQEIIAPPLDRRRDEWLNVLANRLQDLSEKGIGLEDLSSNDGFITTTLHAIQIALRNRQPAKLEALRNAVLNSALPSAPDNDLQAIFLSYVDLLTPLHLRVLALLRDKPSNIAWSNYLQTQVSHFRDNLDFMRFHVADLTNKGLANQRREITAMGSDFLAYISTPVGDTAPQ